MMLFRQSAPTSPISVAGLVAGLLGRGERPGKRARCTVSISKCAVCMRRDRSCDVFLPKGYPRSALWIPPLRHWTDFAHGLSSVTRSPCPDFDIALVHIRRSHTDCASYGSRLSPAEHSRRRSHGLRLCQVRLPDGAPACRRISPCMSTSRRISLLRLRSSWPLTIAVEVRRPFLARLPASCRQQTSTASS